MLGLPEIIVLPVEGLQDNENLEMENPPAHISIDRPAIYQYQLQEKFHHKTFRKKGFCEKKKANKFSFKMFLDLFSIFTWLPNYKIHNDLVGDLIAGFTVAVMHIPQGMAYALLAGVPPIVGLYMAFFPVIMYAVMGTSRHISLGTFAVVCIMCSKVIFEINPIPVDEMLFSAAKNISVVNETSIMTLETDNKEIEVAIAISFCVGIFHILMGVLQLGILGCLFSEVLISGFTTGAAIHVFTSQIKNIFGISTKRFIGSFKIIKTWIDVIIKIPSSNMAAVLISLVCIVILLLSNNVLKPFLEKKIKSKIALPIELLIVIMGTVLSRELSFGTNYGVKVIGKLPTGLPSPSVAPFGLLPLIWKDCLIIAVVSYSISLSLAKIFAKRNNYKINANKELFALGCANLVGSVFSCLPSAASLSRSSIQEAVGGRTQLAGIFSATILVFVLLFLGPLFEPLPYPVLSAIIIVALEGMLKQFLHFPKFWRMSKKDGSIWLITFLSTVILDIDVGLFIGIVLSLIFLLHGLQNYSIGELKSTTYSDIFLQEKYFSKVDEIKNIKVIKITGSLCYINAESFENRLFSVVTQFDKFKNTSKINEEEVALNTRSVDDLQQESSENIKKIIVNDSTNLNNRSLDINKTSFSVLIIDFTNVSYIDQTVINCLISIFEFFDKNDIAVYFCGISENIWDIMKKGKLFNSISKYNFFPTLYDAINFSDRSAILTDEEHIFTD